MDFLRENSLNNIVPHTNVRASLRIMGEHFDIHKVTEVLEMYPGEAWNKGELIRNTQKKRTYTAWIYNTELTESFNIDSSARKIMGIFSKKTDKINLLKNLYDLDISIDFVIVIENKEPPAIYFDSDFIHFASEIDARVDIDTYVN